MDFYEVIRKRRSVRKYKPDPIPDEILERILEAGRLAPSAKNIQPWKFIVIDDPKIKEELVPACRNQKFIAEAPIVICVVALEKIAWGRMGGYWSSYPVDCAIALEHIVLAATNEGLGTCWIGAYDEKEVKKILKCPDEVKVIALTPLGYPAEEPPERSRKPLSEIVCYNQYQE
uniref:Nitroreductase n=1 Tax=candidate division WOR-3 bacterium TaxID=2052148 RepID=A0A7V3ZVM3_UNCW3